MQRTLLPSRPRALGATSRLHPTVCRIRHVQLDDLHTRDVDAGHKIAEVTQLHSKCLIGDKLCLSLRQELSNPRCNKPSHCFLQSPKKAEGSLGTDRAARAASRTQPYECFVMALEGEPGARRVIQTTVKEYECFNQWNNPGIPKPG
jgi:hypothetical protein